MIICYGGWDKGSWLVYCRMFSSLPNLYLIDAGNTFSFPLHSHPPVSLRLWQKCLWCCQMSFGDQNHPRLRITKHMNTISLVFPVLVILSNKYFFFIFVCLVAQPCLTLCDPTDWSPPGSSVHGILQARTLEWVAISFSRGSSRPRDWTQVSCITGRLFAFWATWEAQFYLWVCFWQLKYLYLFF